MCRCKNTTIYTNDLAYSLSDLTTPALVTRHFMVDPKEALASDTDLATQDTAADSPLETEGIDVENDGDSDEEAEG